MHKLLIYIAAAASLALAGCSTIGKGLESIGSVTEIIPRALDKAPLIYRPTIVQGNLVDQQQINKLEPGMSKRQVAFLMGTPMLSDVFHVDRWDYPYTTGVGSTPSEIKHFTVYFENDRLVRTSGDYRPEPTGASEEKKRDVVVSVPDWEGDDTTLFGRVLRTVGVGSE